jgi:small subunit ribosomal protein S6
LNAYELLYISDPRLSEEDSNALKERITGLVKNNGGEIVLEDEWGVRRMAYVIRKQEDGRYTRIEFKSPPAAIVTLDRQLRLWPNVLRFMIVKEGE